MFDEPANYTDAVREYTLNVGRDRRNQAWILSPFDTWERNPFFNGDPAETIFDPEKLSGIAVGYEDEGASPEDAHKAALEYARKCLKRGFKKIPVNYDDDIPF